MLCSTLKLEDYLLPDRSTLQDIALELGGDDDELLELVMEVTENGLYH